MLSDDVPDEPSGRLNEQELIAMSERLRVAQEQAAQATTQELGTRGPVPAGMAEGG